MINRVGRVFSLFGLMLRKTMFKTIIISLIMSIALWFGMPNVCLIVELVLLIICLLLPFGIKNQGGLMTLRRLPFDREDLKVVYAFIAFVELHFGILILKLTSILKVYVNIADTMINKSFQGVLHNPLFMVELEDGSLLSHMYPYSNMLNLVVWNLLFFGLAILITRMVNKGDN